MALKFLTRKRLYALALVLLTFLGVHLVYKHFGGATRIALVNFPGFQASGLMLSNDNPKIKYKEFSAEEIDRYEDCDVILVFGMGLNWTEDERLAIQALKESGKPLMVLNATTPENNIVSLDSVQSRTVLSYYEHGNRRNYLNLGRYIRKEIHGKRWFVDDVEPVAEHATDVYYHLDDSRWFGKRADYEQYLRSIGQWHEGGKRVALIGGLNDPFGGNKQNLDSIIMSFSREGFNVYPVASFTKRLEFLREIDPHLVLYIAHGRVHMGGGDAVVDYLREKNIPMLTPLALMTSQAEWEADPMGMMGGFMSQTIGMPELDGAVLPYVVSTQEEDERGLSMMRAIPERLRIFTQTAKKYVELASKPNKDKRLAIYYFKGPGQETLTAQGLETVPALYNMLRRLQQEGYDLSGLPATLEGFTRDIMSHGLVLGAYARGAMMEYAQSGKPQLVEASELARWIEQGLSPELQEELKVSYGAIPGEYMTFARDGKEYMAVSCLRYGNVALLPQPMAALGEDTFKIVHGANMAPPYPYVAAYLWAHNVLQADAMLHFGTHGSLEFTPRKQLGLSRLDWPDQLVGAIPHFYYYTIANVGESMMAKRRSYAGVVSYLSPAFSESGTRQTFRALQAAIQSYYETKSESGKAEAALSVKKHAVGLGLHRELRLDSLLSKPYSPEEIQRLDNFAEEVSAEKITGELYTTGEAYKPELLHSTVLAMSVDPIAYAKAKVEQIRTKSGEDLTKNKRLFNARYLGPTKAFVEATLRQGAVSRAQLLSYTGLSEADFAKAHETLKHLEVINNPMAAAPREADNGAKKKKKSGGHPAWIPKIGEKPKRASDVMSQRNKAAQAPKPLYTKEQLDEAHAIVELEESILNIIRYRDGLAESPRLELDGLVNALRGGYIAPSSGGDAVANPRAIPTGRNLYAINAEITPTERAWSRAKDLVDDMLRNYKERHGAYPQKVSYTFWSSEFIESEGTTIAQALYMLGVEPIRDVLGRVQDLRLIPMSELGRPRVDVVIQTSGQFRDLAASRLELVNRAIKMASEAGNEADNYVAKGTTKTEQLLVEAGLSPKEARELSTQRIFGGINGMYGTGIQEMVEAGDKWESDAEIAEVYLNNMGALYTSSENWGQFTKELFRASLANTDVVVQPRQSNTWGALSLDHVYEFMGGLNLTVRNVTGKDPEAYFADYRNRNDARIQDLKEAVGVESRSTILNPVYIKQMMQGGASSVARITEALTNTYGWEVSKPTLIDDELWNELYDVYIEDKHGLGIQERFEAVNAPALQEVTAIMLETIRKGMWQATPQQTARLASMHTALTAKHGAFAGGMSGSNAKLQDFIAGQVSQSEAKQYQSAVQEVRELKSETAKDGVVMKKEYRSESEGSSKTFDALWVALGVIALFGLLFVFIRRRKQQGK
ncbi:MAG: cobaltochelatase subunit CobN [Porphyromonas sp.]|nr:cobaltochelatase subunit CobN [Porphyromonas sp.]